MERHSRQWLAAAGVAAILTCVAVPTAASAADFVVPAGLACEFDLGITQTGEPAVSREFTDEEGDVVRTLTAGRGTALVFTNMSTGQTYSLKANGSVTSATSETDGGMTARSTGHNVIIMFPTDVPPGPSTTLYVGRVTYDVGEGDFFTITSSSGRTVDICAELQAAGG